METHFHAQLAELKVKILHMAALTERAIEKSLKAYRDNDPILAKQVIDSDIDINKMECEIDEACLKLLALDQPVAQDLRFIVACMRMIIDLERIGDETVNISEQLIFLARSPKEPIPKLVNDLAEVVSSMFHQAIDAFKNKDAELASTVCTRDTEADQLNAQYLKESIDTLNTDCPSLESFIHKLNVSRSLERIGDQATNLAEMIIFMIKGVSIKHHCQPF
ncbi:phosphate signaling complex protein PhoU [Desulfovibrio inopinatus]|uniref:phosphate signaling complex protein PhoU n=1 Tax=Desulfovibrio inopinatus TaxID=102109 RepID=UPI0004169460|nr:phosphate signaling complex protein PhoU [Desulfovibrio inopinatus]